MTSDTDITVVEGGETVEISLDLNMPPKFICTEAEEPGDECILKIQTEFVKHDEAECTGGDIEDRKLQQAVIGWNGPQLQNAFCGISITADNWNQPLALPVRAKVF